MNVKCFILPWLLNVICTVLCSHIHIQPNGGYSKIVVAISKREAENLPLLKQLEDFFLDLSENLRVVTKNKTFIEEIHVLVPDSWNIGVYSQSTFETYQSADIRLDSFNPVKTRGNVYTYRARECGGRGDFIYVSTQFLQDWSLTHDPNTAHQFLQEWLKLRYEILDHVLGDTQFYPRSNSSARELHEDVISLTHRRQKLCKIARDVKVSFTSENNQLKSSGLYRLPIKMNLVKMSPMYVVIVIDPSFCTALKESYKLSMAIKRFLRYVPKNSKIGCVIAGDKTLVMDLETRNLADQFLRIINMAKSLDVQGRNIEKGVKKGVEMLLHIPSRIGNIVVFSDGILDPSFRTLSTICKNHNLFLFTWTLTKTRLPYPSTEAKEFDHNLYKHLWVHIKIISALNQCDLNGQNEIDDAFALFFNKFGNDDFYPKKIKISSINLQNASSFVNPIKNPLLLFEHNFCKLGTIPYLHINNIDYSNKLSLDNTTNLLPTTFFWNEILEQNRRITFNWTNYPQQDTSSTLWLINDKNIQDNSILLADIYPQKFSHKNDLNPLIIYAFSPGDYSVTVELKSQSGDTFSIDLRDNGNGDPDVMAGDKIYSRYLIHTGVDDVYSVKVMAKDSDQNIIMTTILGSYYIPRGKYLPPNRIGDFRIAIIENEEVMFAWTSPGSDYDHYSAFKYYINCKDNYTQVIGEFDTSSFSELPMIPKESGELEFCPWRRPSRKINLYCVIISVDADGISSELSNLIMILPSASVSNDKSVRAEIIVVGVFGGFIIPTMILIWWLSRRTEKKLAGSRESIREPRTHSFKLVAAKRKARFYHQHKK